MKILEKHIDNPFDFAQRFVQAVQIAEGTFRAVTHNKGIMNGIDAVVLTGNDSQSKRVYMRTQHDQNTVVYHAAIEKEF
jgi:hydroxymethylglutaryl-CoA reductase